MSEFHDLFVQLRRAQNRHPSIAKRAGTTLTVLHVKVPPRLLSPGHSAGPFDFYLPARAIVFIGQLLVNEGGGGGTDEMLYP